LSLPFPNPISKIKGFSMTIVVAFSKSYIQNQRVSHDVCHHLFQIPYPSVKRPTISMFQFTRHCSQIQSTSL
jgi:hypothetical protein